MRNIKLTIEYDGTYYCGWQVQPNGPTIQAVLQKAISKMTGGNVKLIGASRTDAQVHALGQVAHFKTESKISCGGFLSGLNSSLPGDIVINKVEEVAGDFHSKKSAKGKHYRYLIYISAIRPVILREKVWFYKGPKPNIANLQRSAKLLIGEHDFSAFCASGDCNHSKVRRIDDIKVSKRSSLKLFSGGRKYDLIVVDVIGNGFLKYMVRNIIGTLFSRVHFDLGSILASKDRKKAGVTAPASGLYLVEVLY